MNLINKYINLFVEPSQRLYWPFSLLALLIIVIYTKKKNKSIKVEFFNKSSLTDVKLLILNQFLKLSVFPLFLFTSFTIAVPILKALNTIFPYFKGIELSSIYKSIIATSIAFVVVDFFRFASHVLMHRFRLLRKIHATHHSATTLTPLTLFRTHPLEALISSFRNVLSMGIVISSISFIFKGPVSAYDILGVNLFGFLFNTAFSNLRHSNIPISFGPFEYLFISPRMHQIHHSKKREHQNKNYGVALAIWDQILGSFYRPNSLELSTIKYGLQQLDSQNQDCHTREAQEIQLLRLGQQN